MIGQLLVFIAASLLGNQPAVAAQPAERPEADAEAQAILAAMIETYASCESYQDSGTMYAAGQVYHACDFRTSFIAPDRLRFEFGPRDGDRSTPNQIDRVVVWGSSRAAKIWDAGTGLTRCRSSIQLAIDEQWGLIGKYHKIPDELLNRGESRIRRILDLGYVVDGTAWVDGVACDRLSHHWTSPSGSAMTSTICIGKVDHLMRSFEVTREERVRLTVRISPSINGNVGAGDVAFSPPEGTLPEAIAEPIELTAAEVIHRTREQYDALASFRARGTCEWGLPNRRPRITRLLIVNKGRRTRVDSEPQTEGGAESSESQTIWYDSGRVVRTRPATLPPARGDRFSQAVRNHPTRIWPMAPVLNALSDYPGQSWLNEARITAIEPIDGHECFRIVGFGPSSFPETVWIDCSTYLVRRYRYIPMSPETRPG
jgi:hypothetical protein